ncbi:hypothetical protein ACFYYH_03480 [Streptomyces sp. NPDC002018]|uniref:hypothetical protein n=1 Tax=Streptomyces sp. NPDC002018 TaxID=3364629 RepID=UPI0036A3E6AA
MLIYDLAGAGAGAPTYTTNQQFEAQSWVADGAAAVGYTFLVGGAPNIVPLANPRLRVSTNGLFAVEDASLTRRQPRHFFADPAALAQWNRTLARQGSVFQFFPDPPGTVTFTLPGAAVATTLPRVRAANLAGVARGVGDAMTTAENCDSTVREVIGSLRPPVPRLAAPPFLGTVPLQRSFFDYHLANHLSHGRPVGDLPLDPPATHAAALDAVAHNWGRDIGAVRVAGVPPHTPTIVADVQGLGVNQFARPTAVGQGLYTGSLGSPRPRALGGREIVDHANAARVVGDAVDINRVLWGYHWGGVVAIDGTDYLTLENYARIGENAVGQGARLFYFQMYGAGPGQSWHESWETPNALSKAFANAITVPVQVDGAAGLRYFTAGSKNNHADVAAATNDLELQKALCDGLNYANVHLYAASTLDEFADRGRRANWLNGINAVLAAPPAWSTPTTRAFAQYVRSALNNVRVPPL